MRFVFSPPVEAAADLVTLPWDTPLSQWTDDRIVEIPQHGRSRHVVRFVAEAGRVFAVKELLEQPARREYEVLRRLQELGIPAVEVIGVVVDRPGARRRRSAPVSWTTRRPSSPCSPTHGACS